MLSLRSFFAAALCAVLLPAAAQEVDSEVHGRSATYTAPTDPLVLQKLDDWRDLKFGVIFHWGLYSVPGIVESWSICSEDVDWINRRWDMPYDEYKKWYWGIANEFNPVKFDPERWAADMKDAGTIEEGVTNRLHEVGEWLRKNGAAIYGTRNAAHYHEGNLWFTANKDGQTLYALYALPEGETLPETLEWKGNVPVGGKVRLLANAKSLKASTHSGVTSVKLPKGLKQEAVVLEFKIRKQ